MLREEFYFQSDVVRRENYRVSESTVGKSAGERANDKVIEILQKESENVLEPAVTKELEKIILVDAEKYGMEKLP